MLSNFCSGRRRRRKSTRQPFPYSCTDWSSRWLSTVTPPSMSTVGRTPTLVTAPYTLPPTLTRAAYTP